MIFTSRLILLVLAVSFASELASGLKPQPRIDDKSKHSAQSPIEAHKYAGKSFVYHADQQQTDSSNNNINESARPSERQQESSLETQPRQEAEFEASNNFNFNHEPEQRITLAEPYRSLVLTSARFAMAQTSLTNYVNIDTFMDFMSDAGYALSKVSTLLVVFKAVALAAATLLASAFFIPSSLVKLVDSSLRHPERLMHLERYLPNGLNEIGIIGLLNEKTEELLGRLALNEAACREQSVCQAGEYLRCAFPRASKTAIAFISENFSRPKYRSNRYLNAFLVGFIDQNCAAIASTPGGGDEPADNLPRNCASNFIKSLSFCASQQQQSRAQKAAAAPAGPLNAAPQKPDYQTIRAARA